MLNDHHQWMNEWMNQSIIISKEWDLWWQKERDCVSKWEWNERDEGFVDEKRAGFVSDREDMKENPFWEGKKRENMKKEEKKRVIREK